MTPAGQFKTLLIALSFHQVPRLPPGQDSSPPPLTEGSTGRLLAGGQHAPARASSLRAHRSKAINSVGKMARQLCFGPSCPPPRLPPPQFLEGFALGSAVAAAGIHAAKALALAAFYTLSTPLGVAVGEPMRSHAGRAAPGTALKHTSAAQAAAATAVAVGNLRHVS